jgi:16S rRNA G1207 methylase RsmC
LLVDKDFVAVEFSRKNIQVNGLNNAEAMLSNGFSHVGNRGFNLVASNIPAKVGKELLSILLQDSLNHLRDGGRLYVVTVNGLRKFIERNFKEVFGNYRKLKQGAHYTVALAEKPN